VGQQPFSVGASAARKNVRRDGTDRTGSGSEATPSGNAEDLGVVPEPLAPGKENGEEAGLCAQGYRRPSGVARWPMAPISKSGLAQSRKSSVQRGPPRA
jgi:hypothetical protein